MSPTKDQELARYELAAQEAVTFDDQRRAVEERDEVVRWRLATEREAEGTEPSLSSSSSGGGGDRGGGCVSLGFLASPLSPAAAATASLLRNADATKLAAAQARAEVAVSETALPLSTGNLQYDDGYPDDDDDNDDGDMEDL